VAGAAIAAVKQVNDNERKEFMTSCSAHRQQLLDFYSWEFRQTLYTQQQILTKANVPYFQGPAIDDATLDVQSKICSVLHSAFVLHHKVGELGHRALLVKLQQRLQKEIDDNMANAATTAEVAMTSLPPPPPNMGQYAQTGSMAVPPSGFIPPPPPPPHHMSFPPPPAFAPPPPPPPPPGQYSYGNQQQQYHY
jgi:hypothetical protein